MTLRATQRSMFKEYPDLLDIKQMCSMLGISSKTGYKLLRQEKIIALKVGRQYKIPKMNVMKYLRVGG